MYMCVHITAAAESNIVRIPWFAALIRADTPEPVQIDITPIICN